MPLSHILNGIFSTEENPMDVINGTFQKGQTQRKKQVKNVQLKKYKQRKEKMSNNQMKYLGKLHLKEYLTQLNMINKLLMMRMLLLLVRVRDTLPK